MIEVTKLNGQKYWINPHLLELVECNPDTVIKMLSGNKYVILEKAEELQEKIIDYRKKLGININEF